MQGYIGLDFGTANTVVRYYRQDLLEPIAIEFPAISKSYGDTSVIPSQIAFTSAVKFHIGEEAETCNGYTQCSIFRWMKNYLLHQNPYHFTVDGALISSSQAAKSFLTTILNQVLANHDDIAAIGLTVPVDAYEPYETWLSDLCMECGFKSIHIIDEASAAVIGAGINHEPGQIVGVIDFGAGTLDISIVKFEAPTVQLQQNTQHCTVLAKHGIALGGLHIDQWLFQYITQQFGFARNDARIKETSASLLKRCEALKIEVSASPSAVFDFSFEPGSKKVSLPITDAVFEEILNKNHFQQQLKQAVDSTLATLHLKGYTVDAISQVICIGGSSNLPAFQRGVRALFIDKPVFTTHALDAVSRGAALFASGQPFYNHIQHDYALRYYDAEEELYRYRMLVPKGTPYPSQTSLAELYIKPTFAGQQQFGIQIFEINQQEPQSGGEFELFFTDQGSVQLLPLTAQDHQERSHIWLNEQNPTFLSTNTPGVLGENQFRIRFTLDENKRLLISTYDMIEKRWLLETQPVVKLS
jgi:molecular chaperone DnaK